MLLRPSRQIGTFWGILSWYAVSVFQFDAGAAAAVLAHRVLLGRACSDHLATEPLRIFHGRRMVQDGVFHGGGKCAVSLLPSFVCVCLAEQKAQTHGYGKRSHGVQQSRQPV